MLSPSEEVVRAGRLPHNAPITVQLAHPSARQISQQIDSFITWFAKRCVPTRFPLLASSRIVRSSTFVRELIG
jgi:hypothetical protein